MNSVELGGMLFLLGYAALLLLAIRVCGIRRVLWAIGMVVFVALTVAFKSLGAITGSRRY